MADIIIDNSPADDALVVVNPTASRTEILQAKTDTLNYKNAASTSATNASTSATNAATSETNAATSETNAAASATSASESLASVNTSATNASNYATNAATYATEAATQASNASASATTASGFATTASSHKDTAVAQATIATTKANEASTSAAEALASRNEAQVDRIATGELLAEFQSVYHGARTNLNIPEDGTVTDGDLYYNTDLQQLLKRKNGIWSIAVVGSEDYYDTVEIDGFLALKESLSNKGIANGYAGLDANGTVPSAQLPSYVDAVLEVATYSALPATGEVGIIYIVVADENSGGDTSSYRWTGSVYAMVSNTLTGSDIKGLYESEANTNAFTDAMQEMVTSGTMVTDTDLDTLTTGGRYGVIGSGNTNIPKAGEFYLEVVYDGSRTMQIATYTDSIIYSSVYSGSWSSWVSSLDTVYTKTEIDANKYDKTETYSQVELAGSAGNIGSPLLYLPLAKNLDYDVGSGTVTFSRASTATYIDRYGVLQYASIDEPRFEADGLLVEGGSTNKLTYSQDFTQSIWTKTNATINATLTEAPDGSTTAMTFNRTASGFANLDYVTASVGAGVVVTVSAWLKGDGVQSFKFGGFDLGGVTTEHTIDVTPTTEWQRYEHTWTTVTGTTSVNAQPIRDVADSTTAIEVWGAQLEELPFATSYIPTTTAAVTRSVDVCNLTYENNCPEIITSKKTFAVETSMLGFAAIGYIYSIDGASYSFMRYENSTTIHFRNSNGYVGTLYTPSDITTLNSVIGVFDNTNIAVYGNGVLADSDAIGTAVTTSGALTITIGSGNTNGGSAMYGHIKNFKIYDKALTATEVALLGGN